MDGFLGVIISGVYRLFWVGVYKSRVGGGEREMLINKDLINIKLF